mgnify:CR=1 FL=1
MDCPKCRHANPPQAKFCSECGARLASRCVACGAELAAGAKFCGECGAPAGGAEARYASPHSYTPKHLAERILAAGMEGERKLVTVLFADLKGSMELLADRDPEEARKLLDPVLECMMEAVHHYEGTVNQVMGDGIMALFGAPLAHEDHAVRACYAALRMQEQIRRYSEELRRGSGVEIAARVGLNSGEVLVRSIGSDLRMDYSAVGQTTHLASRMEQLATPGATRLTAQTLELAEGYVAVKPLGPVPVKGIADPVQVYELTGASSARTRIQVARARGLTRFVGRDGEMAQLRNAAEEARAGRGQLVAVVGEPGVGKSRLYYEFIHSHHTHGWLTIESGSVSYGKATPYLPLADLLRAYFRIEARDDTRAVRAKVTGNILTLDEALKDAVAPVLWLLDAPPPDSVFLRLDPAERRRQVLAAAKRILLRESRDRPMLLVFEDLHWVDAETQAFLDSLVESLPAAPVLLAVNYRPEYRHAWGGKSLYRQLRIDPLPAESAQDLLRGLLGSDASVAALAPVLIERAQGNPLVLEESVRTLVETGALVGARGAYRLAAGGAAIRVPPTVQAIIAARIDRLDAADKRLLQAAAVVGNDVPFALLGAVAGVAEQELHQSLARLQAAEFLYEARLFPELEYSFKHALTHDVAYGSVLQERKRLLHSGIVAAIERLYADRIAEQIERLAHHALRGGVPEKAVRYLHQAGVKASSGSANRQAVEFFGQALAVLDELPPSAEHWSEALEIRLGLGTALAATAGPASPEMTECYARALELVDRLADEPRRFPALWGIWYGKFTRGEYPDAVKVGEQLLKVARQGNDTSLLLEAHHSLWPVLQAMGRQKDGLPHMEQGLALYRREEHADLMFRYAGHDAGACCRYHLAMARWILGAPDAAVGVMTDALTLARELSHPLTTQIALWFATWLHYERGETQKALAYFEQMQSMPGVAAAWLEAGAVLHAACAGERRELAVLRGLRERLGATRVVTAWRKVLSMTLLAKMYGVSGYPEEGLAVLAGIDADGRNASYAQEICRVEGDLRRALGPSSFATAESSYLRSIELSRERGERSFELRAATSLASLWRHQGRSEEAHRMLSGVYGAFAEGLDTADLRAAKALLAELR